MSLIVHSSVFATNRCLINRLGVALQGKCISGTWKYLERMWHMKELELLAVKFTFETFLKDKNLTSIHIQIVMVARTYLKNGGTKNHKITNLVKGIWEILLSNGIKITVEYLPSGPNKLVHILVIQIRFCARTFLKA